jgi:hypothetical protein
MLQNATDGTSRSNPTCIGPWSDCFRRSGSQSWAPHFASATHFSVASHRSARLVRVLPKWRARDLPVHVVYPAQRRLPLRVRTFIDSAVNYMSTVLKADKR